MGNVVLKGVAFLAGLWILMKVFSVIPTLLIVGAGVGYYLYTKKKR